MAEKNTLATRMQALTEAIDAARDRSPDEVVEAAAAVVRRAGQRVAISGDHTVVAIGGATGSGKSATLNVLTGAPLAASGVMRPTTSEPLAVAWGDELPTELLDWLDIHRRHLIASARGPLTDLVLIDLPDHDSTERAHRATVDRLVPLADMLIWIVDPQKYADAALHDGYLRPMAPYADVMVVVLNQSDRLTPEELRRATADLRALLDAEGLKRSPVLAMSALSGAGVAELRQLLERVVAEKTMTAKRYAADITQQAKALSASLGQGPVPTITGAVVRELNEAMADAAGVPIVERAVRDSWRHRGGLATGWPVLAWLRRFKPDPLKRLRVGLPTLSLPGAASADNATTERTSLPTASPVQKAAMDAGLRKLTDAATAGLPRGWVEAIRRPVRSSERTLADRLDGAIAGANLNVSGGAGWWKAVTVLQWLLFLGAVGGLLWLAVPAIFGYFQMPDLLPRVYWWGLPAPTLLFAIGAIGGVVVAGLSRIGVSVGAGWKARSARSILTARIAEVTATAVLEPVQTELDRLTHARQAVQRAL